MEPRYKEIISPQQEIDFVNYMAEKDLKNAYGVISGIDQNDRAIEKGKSPFFVCRPADTFDNVNIPSEYIPKIEKETNKTLEKILEISSFLEYIFKNGQIPDKNDIIGYLLQNKSNKDLELSSHLLDSIIYFQADTFINLKGEVLVEAIQMPDVGFFLNELSSKGSLKEIKNINLKLRKQVIDNIGNNGFSNTTLVTRGNVLDNSEDLLEINELKIIKSDIENQGKNVSISSVENISFKEDTLYVLMNIDYSNPNNLVDLFELAIKFPKNFSPNPFVQFASKYITGFKNIYLQGKSDIEELSKIVTPRHNKISQDKLDNIENYFNNLGLDPKKRILNIKKGNSEEVLYVSRDSLYSMRKIANFIEGEDIIEIIEVPFVNGEQIISKDGYDLLHMFRFMFTN